MTIRTYLWSMRLCTLAALVSLGLVIRFVDPVHNGLLGQAFFYASLFFSVAGLVAIFLYWLRRSFSGEAEPEAGAGISFRQGALVALAVCSLLVLQYFRLLFWWDGGIVVTGVLLVELWFLSR
jgi:hypothetical protein